MASLSRSPFLVIGRYAVRSLFPAGLLGLIWFPHISLFIVAGTLAILLLWLEFLRSRNRVKPSTFWLTSVVGFLLAIIWVVIGPFYLFAGPQYIFFPKEGKSWSATAISLVDGHPDFGKLLIFPDPIRPYLIDILYSARPATIRVLKEEQYGDTKFVVLPLRSKFEDWSPGPVPAHNIRELYLPGDVRGIAIQFKLKRAVLDGAHGSMFYSTEEPLLRVGIAGAYTDLLTFRYLSSPGRPPWEAIPLSGGALNGHLRYSALLDSSLTLLAEGDPGKALFLLVEAAPSVSDHIEQARLFTLMGKLASSVITGNLGDVQQLLYFNKAFELIWYDLAQKPAIRLTPVENWIYRELRSGYRYFGNAYDDRVKVLRILDRSTSSVLGSNFVTPDEEQAVLDEITKLYDLTKEATPKVAARQIYEFMVKDLEEQKTSKSWFTREEARIRSLTGLQLKREARSIRNPMQARLFFVFTLTSRLPSILVKVLRLSMDSAVHAMTVAEEDLKELEETLTIVLPVLEESWRNVYANELGNLAEIVKTVGSVKEALYAEARGEKDKFAALRLIQQLRVGRFGFPLSQKLVDAALNRETSIISDLLGELLIPPLDTDWWDSRYLEWFSYQVGYLSGVDDPKNPDIETLKKRWETVQLTSISRDHQGRGHPFLPGAVFLAITSSELQLPNHEQFMKDLQTVLEIPPDRLLRLETLGPIYYDNPVTPPDS